jgi:hypothetical protein
MPFGQATALALGGYPRARAKDRRAGQPELCLAEKGKGPLQDNGIRLMIRRRGLAVGSRVCMHISSGTPQRTDGCPKAVAKRT